MGGLIGRPTHPEFPADPPTQKWPTPTGGGGGGGSIPADPPTQAKNLDHHSIGKSKKKNSAPGPKTHPPRNGLGPPPPPQGRTRTKDGPDTHSPGPLYGVGSGIWDTRTGGLQKGGGDFQYSIEYTRTRIESTCINHTRTL